jgi:hypothetical protein
MTISQKYLKRIQTDYLLYFPSWKTHKNDVLYRESGPILQGILFDRSSRDVYKPTGFINVLCTPRTVSFMGLELAQRLQYKNGAPDRSISLKSHEKYLLEVVAELKRQVMPPVEQPLDARNVLELYKKEAQPVMGHAYSLAHFCAYFGEDDEAIHWINRYRYFFNERKEAGLGLPEHDKFINASIDRLEQWIDNSVARTQLNKVVEESRRLMGID